MTDKPFGKIYIYIYYVCISMRVCAQERDSKRRRKGKSVRVWKRARTILRKTSTKEESGKSVFSPKFMFPFTSAARLTCK